MARRKNPEPIPANVLRVLLHVQRDLGRLHAFFYGVEKRGKISVALALALEHVDQAMDLIAGEDV